MHSNGQGKDSIPFRILSLPREIRDQIYRELLLLADKFPVTKTSSYALEPAILRVNSQMHKECTRILYEENTWILITTNWVNLVRLYLEANHPIVSHSPAGHLDAFIRKPALQVDLRDPHFSPQSAQSSMLMIAHDVHSVFRSLTWEHDPMQVRFSVRFDPRLSTKPEVRETLLLSLRDLRGVGMTTVSGIETTTANELATLMMTPMKRMDELFERVDAHKMRGDRQLALGHFVNAERIYYSGVMYLRWAKTKDWGELQDHSLQRLEELMCRKSELDIDRAICYINDDDLNIPLDVHGLDCPDPTRAQAHYQNGLSLLRLGKVSRTLEEFLQALKAQPGHKGADEYLDVIEAKLQVIPQSKK
ncbi:MAG: hypothetical protein ASARMPREDX12_006920 [Alectoria sarmentosa]|nr:MAG: hypothetical protein ASARMPREDX12_006920 [Alectoria sarmentosa]